MFFFFPETDAFEAELEEFRRGKFDEKIADESPRQIAEFQRRYPLSELDTMTLERYAGDGSKKNSFCYWLTSGTRSVAGKFVFAQKRLGVKYNSRKGVYEFVGVLASQLDESDISVERKFQSAIWHPLMMFVKSEGHECRQEALMVFGRSILLKLLILYYPDRYAHIVSPVWLDRIIWAFKLKQSGDFVQKNCEVNGFIRKIREKSTKLTMTDIVTVLCEHLGLGAWEQDLFKDYLITRKGFSPESAETSARDIRLVSQKMLAEGLISHHLVKLQAKDARVAIEEAKVRPHSEQVRSSIELYLSYLAVKSGSERAFRKAGETAGRALVERMRTAADAVDVVRVLQDAAMAHDVYWHYTVLSSLLCILTDKTLRLTRGDDADMNDQLECEQLGDRDEWKRTFITSFSHLPEESVAMWSVYGVPKNEAVRLSLEKPVMQDLLTALRTTSDFSIADSLTDKDSFALQREDVVVEFGDVLYGGKVNGGVGSQYDEFEFYGKKVKNEIIESHALDQAKEMTGYIKSADWNYEKESRLIVRLRDGVIIPKEYENKTHLIVTLPESIFSRIRYVLGPSMGDRLKEVSRLSILRKLNLPEESTLVGKSHYDGRLKLKIF